MSVTATAVIASAFFAAEQADAASHKVQSGDTLWGIAQKYNTTVANLKDFNNLSGDIIFPNQIIETDKKSTSTSAPKKESKPTTSKPASTSTAAKTYTVKAGDTLSQIAFSHGVSYQNLMKWNNLETTLIFPGNVLKVTDPAKSSSNSSTSKPSTSKPSTSTPAKPENNKPASNDSATVYTVKSGDTLSGIAAQYKTTVAKIKELNNLSSDLILIGQKLHINGSATSSKPTETNKDKNTNTSKPKPENTQNNNQEATSTYSVKSGDTLSHIAKNFKTTVASLKALNNLSSDMIYVGQKLKVSGTVTSNPSPSKPADTKPSNNNSSSNSSNANGNSFNVNAVINYAQSFTGVKYVWGGATPSGFDCSGFIHYVFTNQGKSVPRTNTEGLYSRSYYVDTPQVGDLVFFEGTYKSGISHVGIYVGNNKFIHAGTSTGVTTTDLSNSYWSKHFSSYKRLY